MLKNRLSKEGNETVTNLHGLKMLAEDGKLRFTDVAYIKIIAPGKKARLLGQAHQEQ